MIQGTVIVEGDGDTDRLAAKLAVLNESLQNLLVVCDETDAAGVRSALANDFPQVPIHPVSGFLTAGLSCLLPSIETERLAFLPAELPASPLPWSRLGDDSLMPWIAETTFPEAESTPGDFLARGWLAATGLLREPAEKGIDFTWDPLSIAEANRRLNRPVTWLSWRPASGYPKPEPADLEPPLTSSSRIAALVPHYRGEEWLAQCIDALVKQTRPLDAIVVVDDASETPPVEIVKQFPSITLLRSERNSGPYRLVQEVIRRTGFDGYLFQDADDWSAADRLELLLTEAERTGASLIGGQECRMLYGEDLGPAAELAPNGMILPFGFPIDANAAHQILPSYAVLHATSLLARSLWSRLGGFATGLRFGGDTEFQLRATLVSRVVNIPDYIYYRRVHSASLTGSGETGMVSDARMQVRRRITRQALANTEAKRKGEKPDLTPLETAEPASLHHITGPRLR
ncbi:MAG: glycosyltransferase family 2 protein [Acidobacteriota bacterium]|nr:glycosyltransferase family 2 protein [Acidobacteriota bacterium]